MSDQPAAGAAPAAERPDLATGLAAWLSAERGRPVSVSNVSYASAGARRINALFDAHDGDGIEHLVATVIPTMDIQILGIEVEAAVRTLAEEHGVPVPHIHGASADPSWVGGPFFVSDRVDGETVPRRVLRLVAEHGIGERVAEQLGDALARLHTAPVDLAPAGLLRPVAGDRSPAEAALAMTDEQLGTVLQPSPAFALGMRWLERRLPPGDVALTIVHSDVRNGNIIVGDDGLRAILDWEGTRISDPMEDVAWPCLRMWRFRNDDREVGGFAPVDGYRAAYEAAGGTWDEERFRWWKVLGTLRWGLGLAGQANAHLDGRFSNVVMAASGRRVAELEYDLLCLVRPG